VDFFASRHVIGGVGGREREREGGRERERERDGGREGGRERERFSVFILTLHWHKVSTLRDLLQWN
jgi:hypothetical protein